MKILSVLFTLLFTPTLFAANDSIGVFYQPQKIVILINEAGQNSRLQNMLNNLVGTSDYLVATSSDQTIKLGCKRILEAASCTFTFLPGKNVTIIDKTLAAKIEASDLGLNPEQNFDMFFESSRADKVLLKIENGTLTFIATKTNYRKP